MNRLKLDQHIESELELAEKFAVDGEKDKAFHHLERAHVLGQSNTFHHTRIHWLMLKHGFKHREAKEVVGQIVRIAGASTKTPLGIYPEGNTGGAKVSPFKPMPIADDLAEILKDLRR